MSCTGYTPLTKTVILPAVGKPPPVNGTVKIHIKQMLTDGKVLSDSLLNHPSGHEIDLTNTHVLSSLIDELMTMVPGEISQYRCRQEDMESGLFSVDLPSGQDLVIEVEMLDWSGQDISPAQNKSLRKSIMEEGNSKGKPCWTGKCLVSIESEGSAAKETLFRLGDGDSYNVPYPVELCTLTMTRNETCLLETPDSNITLKLLSFEKEKALYKMTTEEVMGSVQELKVRGNNAYKANKLRLAKLYYERCMTYIDSVAKSEQDDQCTEIMAACNLNLAQVYLKMEDYPKAVSYCTTVLWTQPKCVKALYRRAVGHNALCSHDEAVKDLTTLLDQEPGNKEAGKLLQKVRSHKLSKAQKESYLMISVFQKIEEEHEKEGLNGPPPVSVWDAAEETCPPELASMDAYNEYKGALEEEVKKQKEEAAARQAEYDLLNPPKKKKKKRKKKKKPVPEEVTIVETEELLVDKAVVEPVPAEPDAGMEYEVTAEKTFINKIEDPELANVVNSNLVVNGDQGASAVNLNDKESILESVKILTKEAVTSYENGDEDAVTIDGAVADLKDITLEENGVGEASG
ncbi:FK506-binding protein 59-like [Bolinopsis microptera]|uniref:FK506-binding protein 59-like n=1 Tax=Bolinopsis microptera TaxID=2820187 RepID=UPI00307A3FD8